MAASDALRRLGGGRWQTRDGRFTIEPQSGTWVVVDSTQVNEFGLPLVRGPYPSLGAARSSIDAARGAGPVVSPLADRIERSRTEAPASATPQATGPKRGRAAARAGSSDRGQRAEAPRPEPELPTEPAWLAAASPAERRAARAMIDRLEQLGLDGAADTARAEIVGGQPALATLALERRLAAAARAGDPEAAVRAAIEAIVDGRDEALGATWRLVDGDGRRIESLDPSSGDRTTGRRTRGTP